MVNKVLFFRSALIVLLAAIIVYMLYVGIFGGALGQQNMDYNKRFEETNYYLNKTSNYIDEKKYGYDINYKKLVQLLDFYNSEYNKLLSTPGTSYDTIKTLEAYRNLTKATNELYDVTMDLPSIWAKMISSARHLEALEIDKATSQYDDIAFRISYVREKLVKALYILTHTNYTYYIKPEHQDTVEYAINVINETLKILDEYLKLMNIVKDYSNQLSSSNINKIARELGEKLVESIDLENLGPIKDLVSNFITKLLSGDTVSSGSGEGGGGSGLGGSAGGYSGGSEDD